MAAYSVKQTGTPSSLPGDLYTAGRFSRLYL